MSSPAPAESRESNPSESKLTEAIRELIREEIQNPKAPAEKPGPVWIEIFWISVVIANLVMLATQVSDVVVKDSAFEFAFKVIGFVFGGSLVVYASWVREHLVKLANVHWFRATQLTLLFLLVFFHVDLFPITPSLSPPGSHLFIDDKEEHLRNGDTLFFRLASHQVRVLPPTGADKLPHDLEVLPNEFPIGVKDLVFGAYRGVAAQWSPLYPLSIITRFPDSALDLISEARLPATLADLQTLSATSLSDSRTLHIQTDQGANVAVVDVPIGRYTLSEHRPDQRPCVSLGIVVSAESNKADLTTQKCPGVQD
jgi:hypothetical protein